ncbi:MAG: hypothetical protein Edafosvirus6_6 [Edafosvirus sp.]|uniref:Sel1 repeat family protein n=1 Tax=Edafosvirus sp. TaxID=2487765 RepID=A0A3G4ZTE9_9VIRU|nr:MAG: hypothetical protein Edafosvirus6_6 [Edafosvirus sp.]
MLFNSSVSDYKESFKLFQTSALAGNSCGQVNLADMYYNGLGVEQDCNMAYKWYKLSAYQDNINAQCALAKYYSSEPTIELVEPDSPIEQKESDDKIKLICGANSDDIELVIK